MTGGPGDYTTNDRFADRTGDISPGNEVEDFDRANEDAKEGGGRRRGGNSGGRKNRRRKNRNRHREREEGEEEDGRQATYWYQGKILNISFFFC